MLGSKTLAGVQQGLDPMVRVQEVGICTALRVRSCLRETGGAGQEGRLQMKFLGDRSRDWICFTPLLITLALKG